MFAFSWKPYVSHLQARWIPQSCWMFGIERSKNNLLALWHRESLRLFEWSRRDLPIKIQVLNDWVGFWEAVEGIKGTKTKAIKPITTFNLVKNCSHYWFFLLYQKQFTLNIFKRYDKNDNQISVIRKRVWRETKSLETIPPSVAIATVPQINEFTKARNAVSWLLLSVLILSFRWV